MNLSCVSISFRANESLPRNTQTQFRVGLAKSSTENDEYDPTKGNIHLNHFETLDLKFVGRNQWRFCEMHFANGDYPRESAQSRSIIGFYLESYYLSLPFLFFVKTKKNCPL